MFTPIHERYTQLFADKAYLSQVLATNSQRVQEKLSYEGGLVARLVKEQSQDDRFVEELYLSIFSRLPTADETRTAVTYLQTAGKGYGVSPAAARRTAAEDLAWTMLNSLEFVFNH